MSAIKRAKGNYVMSGADLYCRWIIYYNFTSKI